MGKTNYPDREFKSTFLKQALKRGVADGSFLQYKGVGASGSFKLNKQAAKKKPAAKKTCCQEETRCQEETCCQEETRCQEEDHQEESPCKEETGEEGTCQEETESQEEEVKSPKCGVNNPIRSEICIDTASQ